MTYDTAATTLQTLDFLPNLQDIADAIDNLPDEDLNDFAQRRCGVEPAELSGLSRSIREQVCLIYMRGRIEGKQTQVQFEIKQTGGGN